MLLKALERLGIAGTALGVDVIAPHGIPCIVVGGDARRLMRRHVHEMPTKARTERTGPIAGCDFEYLLGQHARPERTAYLGGCCTGVVDCARKTIAAFRRSRCMLLIECSQGALGACLGCIVTAVIDGKEHMTECQALGDLIVFR